VFRLYNRRFDKRQVEFLRRFRILGIYDDAPGNAGQRISSFPTAGRRTWINCRAWQAPTRLAANHKLPAALRGRHGVIMSDIGITKIFMHVCTQAVRLPLAFRLPGDRVRVRRVANGILLEPMVTDIDAWFAALDRFADVPFMEGVR
jgi:antitoxin VapB